MTNTSQCYNENYQKEMELYYLLLIANFEHKRIMSQIVWLNGKMNNRKINTSSIMMIKSHNDIPDYVFLENTHGEFECPETGCEKIYSSISHIKRHYLKHLKTKPLRCLNFPLCTKYFTRKDNMMLHYRNRCKFNENIRYKNKN